MKNCNELFTTAIILAAGSSTRFGEDISKQFAIVGGETVIHRTVEQFYISSAIDKIVIVTRLEDIEFVKNELQFASDKIHSVISGGGSRAESAKIGFENIPNETEFVMIHDGARCLITSNDIDLVAKSAYKTGASSAARAVTDTVKLVSDEKIFNTLSRQNIILAETPQAFSANLYRSALDSVKTDDTITDDNMLFEKMGIPITPVYLPHANVKITTKSDIEYAEFLLLRRNDFHMNDFRIGHGYDVHAFAENRKLILGGVDIPYDKGLLGHSDADVLVHAVMDSLLGALGKGDIGNLFPDTSDEFFGISSLELLRRVGEVLVSEKYEILNVDTTLVMQTPKVAPYVEQMKSNISNSLNIKSEKINIKATTEEKLGFTGRQEGVRAEAVALIKKRLSQ